MSKPTSIQLREWRLRLGFTQAEAAEKLWMEPRDFNDCELGKKHCRPSTLEMCRQIEAAEKGEREPYEVAGSRSFEDIKKLAKHC